MSCCPSCRIEIADFEIDLSPIADAFADRKIEYTHDDVKDYIRSNINAVPGLKILVDKVKEECGNEYDRTLDDICDIILGELIDRDMIKPKTCGEISKRDIENMAERIRKMLMGLILLALPMFGFAASTPVIVSAGMRASDPTIMDVVYKVTSETNVVNVRALAFENGTRSFQYVVRPTTFVKDVDGNETAGNIGSNVAANVEHKLAWKVSADWDVDLTKAKFEILVSEQAQLPMTLNHIKAVGKYPALTIGVGEQSNADIFDALL